MGILQKEDFIFLAPADIIYIEARRNNCVIYMAGRAGGVLISSSINNVMDLLPQQLFCRIHRSYIVSLPHIRKLNRRKTRLFFQDNKTAPIGRFYLQQFLEKVILLR